ncbi:Enoyl-[acyl-carrier-protein] reductase [NADPH, B-specific] 2, mitochondrial, partial [Ancistrocladus abbreviatus]
MSNGMRKPMHSILGLLSVLQVDNFSSQQRLIIDIIMKTNNVLSVLINDVMDDSPKESGRFPSEVKSFSLHALIKDAGCVSRCLCADKGFDFAIEANKTLPNQVMGDERRVFQVILHMVGNLLDNNKGGAKLTFRVFLQHGSQGRNGQRWAAWKSGSSDGYLSIYFEADITFGDFFSDDSVSTSQFNGQRRSSEAYEGDISFIICQKLVQ